MAKTRDEIDAKYKWDLSKIYADETAFSADFSVAEDMIKAYSRHESTMCDSAEGLLLALRDMVAIQSKILKLHGYAYLSFATDTSDNASQALLGRVRNLAVAADNATWFVSPYIVRLDEQEVERWYVERPELRSYSRIIDAGLREKPYTLSDECERLATKMGECLDSHGDIRGIFANSDLQFGKIKGENGERIQVEDSNYVTLLMSGDRRVRKAAFTCLYKTYEQFKNTFASMYSGYVKEQCTLAKIRRHKSSLHASTFRDEVTPVIYNNLIKSINRSMSVIYDYYDLKREVLRVDRLHMYDLYAPLVGESDAEYGYDRAVDEVLSAVKIFGEEYYSVLEDGLCRRGWVDVYPTKGKMGGAFSSGCPETDPYILLNYTNTLNDISVLAHEAGHSMHSYFSRKYNEPHNSQYTIFVAEVASTVNELLLAHKKIRESDSDNEKLIILDELMETYKGTLYRQTMFAEFERDIHALCEKGEPLTADVICGRYKKLINKYFGPRVAKDRQICYEWMRIPHFYTNFYVYKYATCISAASAIVKRIETEGEEYVGKYIDFLKCGGSRSPLESLKVAGIDMTDPRVVDGAVEDFAATIAEFRRIWSKTQQ